MKIKILVPVTNITPEENDDSAAYLKPYLRPDTELVFDTIYYGFPTVECYLNDMFNGTSVVMNVLKTDDDSIDGIFIDCFDNPGVYAARELGKIPVLGPYDASIATALQLGERIGVITTDEAGILSEERKARHAGFSERIAAIRQVDMGVGDLKTNHDEFLNNLEAAITDMVVKDRISVVCLGCTAMFYVIDELRARLSDKGLYVNIVEPLLNGVLALENIINQGFTNYIPGKVDLKDLHWIQDN